MAASAGPLKGPGIVRGANAIFAFSIAVAITVAAWGLADRVTGAETDPPAPDPAAIFELAMVDGRVRFENVDVATLGLEALDLIDYDWEVALPLWTIDFIAREGNVAGLAWSAQSRIEVFVRRGDTATSLARVLAHELGHAVDLTYNTPETRRQWIAERGLDPGTPWWPGDTAGDFTSGAGDFAEAFAHWLLGTDDFRSELGPVPTDAELERLSCLWLLSCPSR